MAKKKDAAGVGKTFVRKPRRKRPGQHSKPRGHKSGMFGRVSR